MVINHQKCGVCKWRLASVKNPNKFVRRKIRKQTSQLQPRPDVSFRYNIKPGHSFAKISYRNRSENNVDFCFHRKATKDHIGDQTNKLKF